MAADRELSTARKFLAPVLQRDLIAKTKGQGIIQRLLTGNEIECSAHSDTRKPVIRRALTCLLDIHRALLRDATDEEVEDVLLDSSKRRVVDALLDLISLEGIYPNLLPGVGVPIQSRVRSVVREGVNVASVHTVTSGGEREEYEDNGLLIDVVEQLRGLTKGKGNGLCGAFQQRTLVDLIAAVGQLAFGSGGGGGGGSGNVFYGTVWRGVISSTPTAVLWKTMMPLLHKDCPLWLQVQITTSLATLPLRPDGVKQFIIFRAQSSASTAQMQSSSAFPPVSLDVLQIISKLLSSPPKALSPGQYFRGIAPQLLELLDEDDDEARRVASFMISSGILSKRATGAPGSIGWKLFVQPIHTVLNPNLATGGDDQEAVPQMDSEAIPILSMNEEIQRAARRLACLTLIHPNPPLTQRLLKPLLKPLWGLACHCTDAPASIALRERCLTMVSVFLKFAQGTNGYLEQIDQLLYDGEDQWTYHVSLEDVEIRRREGNQFQETGLSELLDLVNGRVRTYLSLLRFCDVSDDEIGEIFAYAASHWLQPDQARKLFSTRENMDSRYGLIYARLTQEMILTYESHISRRPEVLLRLITEVLDDTICQREQQNKSTSRPRISNLHSIVTQKQSLSSEPTSLSEEEASNEILEVSLSLLSTILLSSDFAPSDPNILVFLSQPLEYLASDSLDLFAPSVPPIARRLLDSLSTKPSPSESVRSIKTQDASDTETHNSALSHLSSPLPPVRYEGLSLLSRLIHSRSPILPLAPTTTLLLSLLSDPEEHVYLGAISTLATLATLNPRPTIRRLVEAYVDPSEDLGLDARLRVGEVLRNVVEGLGEALIGDSANVIGEGMIAIAGRRGRRPKELKKEQERIAREARRAGDGDTDPPPLTLDLSLSDGDSDSDDGSSFHSSDAASRKAHKARLESILAGWRASPGMEDLRVRTSALSILGIGFETNIAGFAPKIVEDAIEIAVLVLQLERGEESIILCKAAIVLLDTVVQGGGLGVGGRERLRDMLRYAEGVEGDEVVRGMVEGLRRRVEEGFLAKGVEGRKGGKSETMAEKRVERARGILEIGRGTSSLAGTGDGGWKGAIQELN